MPPRTQRRNTAYLNRWTSRFGPLDRGPACAAPQPGPDLRLISMARSNHADDRMTVELPTWTNCYLGCAA
jgi:hypothetical protein